MVNFKKYSGNYIFIKLLGIDFFFYFYLDYIVKVNMIMFKVIF